MINIYTDKSKIPSNLEYVHDNDLFFLEHGIQDIPVNKRIIEEIDKARYYSRDKFIDRYNTSVFITCLSTSSKILINAVNNPDKIFNAVELGRNAYEYMIYCLDNCNLYFRDNVQYDAPENDTDISRIVLNGKPIESIYDLE